MGICGTDYSGFLGKMPFFRYPRIPGHELGVEVLEVGIPHFRYNLALRIENDPSTSSLQIIKFERYFLIHFTNIEFDGSFFFFAHHGIILTKNHVSCC